MRTSRYSMLAAALALHLELVVHGLAGARAGRLADVLVHVRGREHLRAVGEHLLARHRVHLEERRVDVDDAALRVAQDERVGGAVEHRLVLPRSPSTASSARLRASMSLIGPAMR